jgi:MiaB-like tRNA modifying enzyme
MNIKTAYIETYGCSANRNNSEIISGILERAGIIIIKNIDMADIVILNSCVVKGKTESKILRRIQDLKKILKSKVLIVTGCLSQTDSNRIKKINGDIILLGVHHIKDILNLIRDIEEKKIDQNKQQGYLSEITEEKIFLPKIPENKLIGVTQISEGCLGECSYCKTRLAKGKLHSYDFNNILKSIENDLVGGAKEIWITSQDNASYGLDRGKSEFISLIDRILSLNHNFKLRLGMCNPDKILPLLEDFIRIYGNKKIYKFLHIPIQSASNNVLSSMNRKYKIEEAEEIINKLKSKFNNLTIATDIIVGYPTETREDHRKNVDFIKKINPDVLNISKFSSHKQTPAEKLKTLPANIIRKRTSEIMEVHRGLQKNKKILRLGEKVKVFVNRKISEHLYEARDESYNIYLIKTIKENLGKEIYVEIVSAGVHNFIGKEV